MYILSESVTCFDSFGVEHIQKETKKFIDNKNIKGHTITTNIFRIQACDSATFRYFCIGFIDFILKGKSLTDFTNLFSQNDFKKK